MNRASLPFALVCLTACGSSESVAPEESWSCATSADCDDGLTCSGAETCVEGLCQPGEPLRCAGAPDPCTRHVCLEPVGCAAVPVCQAEQPGDAAVEAGRGQDSSSPPAQDAGSVALGPMTACQQPVLGDVEVATQSDLEPFSEIDCIQGSLHVHGSEVVDLSPLGALKRVDGDVQLQQLGGLRSLAPLDSLQQVGGSLRVTDLRGAAQMTVFEGLEQVGDDIALSAWVELEQLCGFSRLQEASKLTLRDMPHLRVVGCAEQEPAFAALRVLRAWTMEDVPVLQSLRLLPLLPSLQTATLELGSAAAGGGWLEGAREIGELVLEAEGPALRGPASVVELGRLSLTDQGNRKGPERFTGFEALQRLGGLDIQGARELVSLEGLRGARGLSRLALTGVPQLSSLAGVQVGELAAVEIHVAPALKDLVALRQIRRLTNLSLRATGLASLDSLKSLQLLNTLSLVENPELVRATGLSGLEAVQQITFSDNPLLEEVGWSGLLRIEYVNRIWDCPALSECQVRWLVSLARYGGDISRADAQPCDGLCQQGVCTPEEVSP